MGRTAENGIYPRAVDRWGLLEAWRVEDADVYEVKKITEILQRQGCRTVLYCSCGTGILAVGLAKQGFEVTAIDTDEEALAKAKKRAETQGVTIRFENRDVRDLHKRFHDMDAVICWHSEIARFQEGAPLRTALGSIHHCLRDGGVAIFETFGFDEFIDENNHYPMNRVLTGLAVNGKRGSIVTVGSCPSMGAPYHMTLVFLLDEGDLGNIDFYHNCVEFAPVNIKTFQDYLEYTGFLEIEVQDNETTVHYICQK